MASVIFLKLTAIGTSLGVVLPEDALARLKLEEGDTLYLTEAPDGYRLTSSRIFKSRSREPTASFASTKTTALPSKALPGWQLKTSCSSHDTGPRVSPLSLGSFGKHNP